MTIEGGEGQGKSTLIDRLYTYLTEVKQAFVVKTFEPGELHLVKWLGTFRKA